MATKFGMEDRWDIMLHRGSFSHSPLRGIMQFLQVFKGGLVFEVGDGRRVKFWEYVWCGERSFKQDFPYVFGLVADPTIVVASNFLIQRGEIVWSSVLRRDLFDWEVSRVT